MHTSELDHKHAGLGCKSRLQVACNLKLAVLHLPRVGVHAQRQCQEDVRPCMRHQRTRKAWCKQEHEAGHAQQGHTGPPGGPDGQHSRPQEEPDLQGLGREGTALQALSAQLPAVAALSQQMGSTADPRTTPLCPLEAVWGAVERWPRPRA